MRKYLARRKDGRILKQNKNGTYSFLFTEMHAPYEYTRDQLSDEYFEEITEKDFKRMEERKEEYYSYLSWRDRSDGHDGIKGGTIEEYRALQKNKI